MTGFIYVKHRAQFPGHSSRSVLVERLETSLSLSLCTNGSGVPELQVTIFPDLNLEAIEDELFSGSTMETTCEEGHVPISPTTQTHCSVEGSIYQEPAVRPAGHTVRRKDNKQILSATALPKRRSVPASSPGRWESTAPSTAMSPSLPPAPPDDGTA